MLVTYVEEWEELRVKGAFSLQKNHQVICSQHAYHVAVVDKRQTFHITIH